MQTIFSHLALNSDFRAAALEFWKFWGFESPKVFDFPALSYAQTLKSELGDKMNPNRAHGEEWDKLHLLFQFTDDELGAQQSIFAAKADRNLFEAFVFVALELKGESYNRTQLADIARELNKPFASPVIVLFKHGASVTVASVARREHKRDAGEHVLQKVSLLKDIRLPQPHAAHERILSDLGGAKVSAHGWTEFLARWNAVLDISELNKKFYRELSNWFFAAREHAIFPDPDENATERGLIRLLTRLIFTWFVKERGLIPNELFDPREIAGLLKKSDGQSDTYYRAVLQNLFFATLNTEMDERRFRSATGGVHGQAGDYGMSCFFRFQSEFKTPEKWLTWVKDVPFLNGGLFECLDPEDKDGARIDGFSDNAKRQTHLPNFLFWGEPFRADLSSVYDDKKQKSVAVVPLLNLLHAYKFTIEESTPLEEDVALDPELLGKVFENLLASYNPETRTTARKQLGAFYTPREIVSYMVEEALRAYLAPFAGEGDLEALLSETDARGAGELGFSPSQIKALIGALERVTILDPACGSGAFPMGALGKMVALLKKLDPKNQLWLETQLQAVDRALEATGAEKSVVEDAKNRVREAFGNNDPDYARKLYLIERCLFGVDIQPIALQIAKLRFFIALIIDQRIDDTKTNRNIRALPNLETKFVAANTLISPENQLTLTWPELDELLNDLDKVRRAHVSPKSRAKKKELERDDKRLTGAIKHEVVSNKFDESYADAFTTWNPYNQNAVCPFFAPRPMFGPELQNGFDIVIGNPPYGAEITSQDAVIIARQYKLQNYQADTYLLFMEKALQLAKSGSSPGTVSFIVPNTWLLSLMYKNIRRHFFNHSQITDLVHLKESVFAAVVDAQVFIARNKTPDNGHQIAIHVVDKTGWNEPYYASQDDWRKGDGKAVSIAVRPEFASLLSKLNAHTTLDDWCKVTQGCKPFQVGKGKPPQTRAIVNEKSFVSDHKKNKTFRPLLRGSLMQRYINLWDENYWISFGDWLAEPRYSADYDAKEKIIIRQTGDSLVATIDNQQFIVRDNLYSVVPLAKSTKAAFILGVVNSLVSEWFYETILNPEKGEALAQVKRGHLIQLPIPTATPAQQAEISKKVEKILAAKAADSASDTSQLEREIDELVAELYGLDADEKKLVGLV